MHPYLIFHILIELFIYYPSGYDQFGISRKGAHDTSDEHCTILYDREKVCLTPCLPSTLHSLPVVYTFAIWFKKPFFMLLICQLRWNI